MTSRGQGPRGGGACECLDPPLQEILDPRLLLLYTHLQSLIYMQLTAGHWCRTNPPVKIIGYSLNSTIDAIQKRGENYVGFLHTG